MLHNLHSAYRVNFNNISKGNILHKNISDTVVKTSENDLSKTIFVAKVEVEFYING